MKFLPNRLQLDILKRHAGPFIFCFFTIIFLLLMQFLILYIDLLIGKGLPFSVIMELIVTNLASMVVLAIPMAILVAALMAFGKVTELNELTAIRAAGINPFHVITPVIGAAIIMSIFLVWFSNDVLPDANQRARSLFIDIKLKKPAFDLKPNEFYSGIDNYTFLVKKMTHESDSLKQVTIYQEPTKQHKEAYIKARSGHLESDNSSQTTTLDLRDGTVTRYLTHKKDHKTIPVVEKTNFARYRITFDMSELAFSKSNPKDRSRSDRTMNIQAMKAVVDSLKVRIDKQKDNVLANSSYIIPTRNYEVNRGGRSFDFRPDSLKREPYKSKYLTLNKLDSKKAQLELTKTALRRLDNYKSLFENFATDTHWRTRKISQYMVEIYKKFSIPIACLVFVLLGAPIGMLTKKGNLGYAALIGTVFLTTYWISIIQGEKLADRLTITAFTGMWFSDIVLGLVGIILMIQICTSFRFKDLWQKHE